MWDPFVLSASYPTSRKKREIWGTQNPQETKV
jgi:hypothetical protein